MLQLDPRARILVAGQAPGRKAHASGIPFSDASGDRLREWMGLTAEPFYGPARVAILPFVFSLGSIVALTLALECIDVGIASVLWSGAGTAAIAAIGLVFFHEAGSTIETGSTTDGATLAVRVAPLPGGWWRGMHGIPRQGV